MTREEAIEIIKAYREKLNNSVSNQLDGDIKALDMAISALEQEPCEDAVSRDAVLKTLDNMDKALDENRTVEEYKALLKECYKELPSVTQKSGKWITEEIGEGRKVYCSECKESAVFEYVRDGDIYSSYGHGVVKKTKYCPNCGAKMESEDKE